MFLLPPPLPTPVCKTFNKVMKGFLASPLMPSSKWRMQKIKIRNPAKKIQKSNGISYIIKNLHPNLMNLFFRLKYLYPSPAHKTEDDNPIRTKNSVTVI